jgi:hypothetical protein
MSENQNKPVHVSSSMTLLLKFGLPTAWLVFFGAMTAAMWFTDDINAIGDLPVGIFRLIFTASFFALALLIYWSLMRIKRVEMDKHFFYVTDYFKNVRYPYHQIEKIVEKDYLLFKVIHIILKTPATFGKKITFISSRERFDLFLKEYPEVVEELNHSLSSISES